MRAWELVKLALEGVRRTPLRIALTAAGIAIATGALLSMVAFAEGLQEQAERPFEELDLLSRIEVWSEPGAEDEEPPSLDAAALEEIRALPGVELAYVSLTKAGIEVSFEGESREAYAVSLPREAARLEARQGRWSMRALIQLLEQLEPVPGRKALLLFHQNGTLFPGRVYGVSDQTAGDLLSLL